ncbi:hypothetical protein ACVXG7_26535 [Enterobacter hormaechei]
MWGIPSMWMRWSIQRGRIYKGRSAPASALTDYCWILDGPKYRWQIRFLQ